FMIITPVKRKSGEANITLIFKSGSDSVFTTFKVTVNKPSEIDDFNLNNTILIFPNPSDNRLSIISNNIAPLGIIEIYTLMGIKVFSIEAQNNRTEIDISSFTAGIYFVKIGDFRQIFVKN
ncbi:MAG: T9SS type A sorting domain-containing protein, partial [FCB group bacterium]